MMPSSTRRRFKASRRRSAWIAPRLFAIVCASLLALPALAADYLQAPGSTLVFAGKFDGALFVGRLPGFDTRLSFDPAQLDQARLEVTIPLASVDTDNADRDTTLLGEMFFNVARFPQARYVATQFRHLGGNHYAADGQLRLRGVTRPVTLEFSWTPGANPVLRGDATVKRLQFGVGSGDWADTELLPNDIAVSTHVNLRPVQ